MKMKFTKVLLTAALLGFMGMAQADHVRDSGVYRARSCQGAYSQLRQTLEHRADRQCRGRVVHVRFHRNSCRLVSHGHHHRPMMFRVSGSLGYDCVRHGPGGPGGHPGGPGGHPGGPGH